MKLAVSVRYLTDLHKHLTSILGSLDHDIHAYYHLKQIIDGIAFVLKHPHLYAVPTTI